MKNLLPATIAFVVLLLPRWVDAQTATQPKYVRSSKAVTTPKEHFGFNMGDDYCLVNYQQLYSYWLKIERQTDRLKVVKIGKTEEGREQLMGIVTAPANFQKLEQYKEIARRLARADGIGATAAARLTAQGKAVVWIDGGLHASEVLCAQMLTETLYQYVTATDPETLRILNDVIILFVHANPDGMDLVADHYMNSSKDPTQRKTGGLPRLYQKYIGHDNNRDFYANTQAETKNMNRVMYREWFPQIVFNHHQAGPQGTVLFCPPFRDPANYNIDPLVTNGIDRVGAAMMERFLAENKPGATCRSGARYSGWWNGGLRTTCTFHNMIGLLTETIGSPTPMDIPLMPDKLLPYGDYLAPVSPQKWHFRQSVDYSVSSNKAVLDYASRNREHLLHNIWLMGKNAIDRGSRDTWTITPKVIQTAKKAGAEFTQGPEAAKEFERYFHQPERRDSRGYIIPTDQADFLTATKFVNCLLATGITVQRATADFGVAGKKYSKGSYIVKSAQAFRPHLLDMFEPQDHPDDFVHEGAAPTPPYDSAGWTLAMQMAVQFDRILDGFDGPFEEIQTEQIPPPPGQVFDLDGAVGFYLSTRTNDSFRAVNQLLKAGEKVSRLREPIADANIQCRAGTFFIARKETTLPLLQKIAFDLGTNFIGNKTAPDKEAFPIKPVRVGLWDTKNGGSMPSGWTRWLLEQFAFPFQVIYGTDLADPGLREKFDVLILVDGALGGGKSTKAGKAGGNEGGFASAKNLGKFLEAGGTILAIGSSTSLGKQLGLPVSNHLAGLPREKYFVPSSVLRVAVNPDHPLAWGMEDHVDVMFANSPTFKLPDGADRESLEKLAWFDTKTPLRSGWAWGQQYLEGGIAMIDAKIGDGRLTMFGPQILFRGQPHGTFKFLFNGIVRAGAP